MYGPLAKSFQFPNPPSIGALSSLGILYAILFPEGLYPPSPQYADVRDVAKAHVLALKAQPASSVGRKRIIFGSPHELDFEAMREVILRKLPGFADRWTKKKVPNYRSLRLQYDMERLEDVLGMGEADFHSVEDTLTQSIDSLVALESEWATGHDYKPEGAPTIPDVKG